eukprot:Cvel_31665.t1-p1 / transcript=Cvel_31665.t1 / gene=Cvel_31665 / organism=Chromera_velia_CCMP2878 / gene_product=Kinesin light chain 3, putative / transcript_product=Kinesin light chain 3, putative / location=Cvel_scaffold4760:3764-6339(-) / protein_length=546 / sequence_SO=supercontig / SO=protein_coding / is_pseudo=false
MQQDASPLGCASHLAKTQPSNASEETLEDVSKYCRAGQSCCSSGSDGREVEGREEDAPLRESPDCLKNLKQQQEDQIGEPECVSRVLQTGEGGPAGTIRGKEYGVVPPMSALSRDSGEKGVSFVFFYPELRRYRILAVAGKKGRGQTGGGDEASAALGAEEPGGGETGEGDGEGEPSGSANGQQGGQECAVTSEGNSEEVEAFAESLDALNRGLQEEKEESSHLFGLPVKRFDALRDWLESLRKDKVLCRDTVSRLLKSPAQVPPSALSELLEASRLLSPRLSLVGREQIVSFLFSAVEAHRERRLEPVESSEALYGVLFLNKADDLVREGKFEEAMEAYETALRVRKQVFGEDSQCPETALILNRMASLFMRQKKHEEAVRRLRSETAAVFERLSFKDTENAAKAAEHHKVAKSFAEKAKLREAEKGYRQALQVKKRVFGDVHLSIANTTSNLAVVLQRQRKYGEALEMYEETLRVKKTIFGDEHPATADTLYSMGVLLETQGEYKKAHEMFEEALRVRKQVLGDQHPDTASTHLCVARTEEACR